MLRLAAVVYLEVMALKKKYQIGLEVGKELFDTIKSSNCEIVTTECGTCQAQIKHGTGQKAYHPVTVIRKLVENK